MQISKINDQPYSKELEKKIKKEKNQFLIEERIKSSQKPYAFNWTNDKLTLLFERTDNGRGSVSLPFQTNVTDVTNTTDYIKKPKFNWGKNLFLGTLEYVKPEKLVDFLNHLKNCDITKLKFVYKEKNTQDPDWNSPSKEETVLSNPRRMIKQAQGSNLEEQINNMQALFINAYSCRFLIDPKSFVRVEKRSKKDSDIYTASLSFIMYTGLSGVPGLNNYVKQKVIAKIKK